MARGQPAAGEIGRGVKCGQAPAHRKVGAADDNRYRRCWDGHKKPAARKCMMKRVRMYTTEICPFCIRAKALLKQRGVAQIDEIRVDLDPSQRVHMMNITGRRTVPQIFIGDTHVGGCDDLMALDQRGGLMPMLAGS
jgi:glutaredoxin 3